MLQKDSLIMGWWDRLHGRLRPHPMPFALRDLLDARLRDIVASPNRILGAFGLTQGERVLEIGAGTGHYSVEAARRIGPDGRLVCLDIQWEMLTELRRRLEAPVYDRVYLIQASATALPLRASTIDHVLLIGVLGEIPNHRQALAEMRRVLRPQGRLSVSEQLPDPDFVTIRTLRRELNEMGFREIATHGSGFYTSTWRVAA